jgi:hypothetical protein
LRPGTRQTGTMNDRLQQALVILFVLFMILSPVAYVL